MRTITHRLTAGRGLIAAALLALGATGCKSYQVIKPLAPAYDATIKDLQPTFSWAAAKEPGVTYDIGVWAVTSNGNTGAPAQTEAYIREGLTETQHRMETPLAPGTRYTWAVRTRKGDQVSEWSRRQVVFFTGLTYDKRTGPMRFRTR